MLIEKSNKHNTDYICYGAEACCSDTTLATDRRTETLCVHALYIDPENPGTKLNKMAACMQMKCYLEQNATAADSLTLEANYGH